MRETLTKDQRISDGQKDSQVARSGSWDTTKKDLHATGTALLPSLPKTKCCRPWRAMSAVPPAVMRPGRSVKRWLGPTTPHRRRAMRAVPARWFV